MPTQAVFEINWLLYPLPGPGETRYLEIIFNMEIGQQFSDEIRSSLPGCTVLPTNRDLLSVKRFAPTISLTEHVMELEDAASGDIMKKISLHLQQFSYGGLLGGWLSAC